jgi:large subunit ribosomal protein L9
MKVLLLADVRGVGRRGEIKEVAEGYGRNFLIAKKLAAPASGATLSAHQATKAQKEANDALRLERAKAAAAKISGQTLKFFLRTDKQGSVFGSVKPEEVLRAIADEFGDMPDAVVVPKQPLKTTGDHDVVVSWKNGVEAKLTASVLPQ